MKGFFITFEGTEGSGKTTVIEKVEKYYVEKGYQVIFDRASSTSIVFASPRIDVSNEVLAKLGYSK